MLKMTTTKTKRKENDDDVASCGGGGLNMFCKSWKKFCFLLPLHGFIEFNCADTLNSNMQRMF